MPSTVIKRFNYRPEAGQLEILFVTGRRYVYADVPPADVEAFRAECSNGMYYNRHIRDSYARREMVD